jgi:hypothetical protein
MKSPPRVVRSAAMSSCHRLAFVALALVAPGCKPASGGAPPSARDDCARVMEISERERKRIPAVEELGTTRLEVNAAKAVRDYVAKLDAIPVNDKGLNNKLADYSDQLRKMAKALDELWTARDADKAAYVAKAQQAFNGEDTFVNDINAYCQSAR